jgi:CHAD domain-containing protein
MSQEREAKLVVGPAFRLPDLGGLVDGIEIQPATKRTVQSVYFDTEDVRLARWGCSLRWRSVDGWTVKLPAERHGDLLVRGELRFEGSASSPPADAVDLLRAYVRTSRLAPSVRLRTVRSTVGLRLPDGRPAGEVDDDSVSVLNGRTVDTSFREIEVELTPDAPDALLSAAIERLRSAGAGEPTFTAKYPRALGARAELPPELVVAQPPRRSRLTVEELVRAALSDPATDLLRNDAGVRLGDDAEAVHKMRVATRRLRSDLRTFRSVMDPSWATRLRQELGWLGGELGAVRDADVLVEGIGAAAADLPQRDRAAAARVLDRLDRRRDDAVEALRLSMSSDRYVTLLDDVVAAANAPAVSTADASSAASSLGVLMEGPWRRLERRAVKLRTSATDSELHRLRILAKRARYGADALGPAFGRRADAFADAAAALQDVLGEHHDAVVAASWLRETAIASSPAAAFAAGLMASHEQRRAQRSRAGWRRAWKALARPKMRFWS